MSGRDSLPPISAADVARYERMKKAAARRRQRLWFTKALGAHGVQLKPEADDDTSFCIAASVAISKLIAEEAGADLTKADDLFTAVLVSFVVSNYVTQCIGDQFEQVSAVVALELIGLDRSEAVPIVINMYNQMSEIGAMQPLGEGLVDWVNDPAPVRMDGLTAMFQLLLQWPSKSV